MPLKYLRILTIFLLLLASVATSCAAPRPGIKSLGYAIQVGAFSQVSNAERLTNKLQEKGIEAFYFKRENGIYAVRFGDFESRDLARRTASKLVSERIISSYFIAPPRQENSATSSEPSPEKAPASSVKNPPQPKKRERQEPHHERGGDMGSIAARTAERFVGIPYRWGGDTVVDGMDCSGFVRAVYNLCGIKIPRTSREQYRVGDVVGGKDELKEGDLVFFGGSPEEITHVGIFVGNGRFVHAPRRGDDIKLSSLDESYYVKKFVGAKRYF